MELITRLSLQSEVRDLFEALVLRSSGHSVHKGRKMTSFTFSFYDMSDETEEVVNFFNGGAFNELVLSGVMTKMTIRNEVYTKPFISIPRPYEVETEEFLYYTPDKSTATVKMLAKREDNKQRR